MSTTLSLTAISVGLLVLRLVVGLSMAAHGTQKLFGWFGGHGLAGTGGFFEMLGFRPGRVFAFAAGAAELVSGILIALGFSARSARRPLSVMIVAALTALKNGFFAASTASSDALCGRRGDAGVHRVRRILAEHHRPRRDFTPTEAVGRCCWASSARSVTSRSAGRSQ
jgi:putative oxidoreductase